MAQDRKTGGGLTKQPDPPYFTLDGGASIVGLVLTFAPIDGDTGAGLAGPSSLAFRMDVPTIYINTGTKNSPAWKAITHA